MGASQVKLKVCYHIAQNFGTKNYGEFGEMNAIRQYFTQPNSRFTKVAKVSNCKFANIFLTKTLKRSIRQSFAPPKFVLYDSKLSIMLNSRG